MGPARALNKAREKRDGRRDRPMVHASLPDSDQTVTAARLDAAGRWLDRDDAASVTSVSAKPAAGVDADEIG